MILFITTIYKQFINKLKQKQKQKFKKTKNLLYFFTFQITI